MAKKTAKKAPKPDVKPVQRVEYVAMCAGDSQLFMCDSCLAEFELIYEPKAQGSGDQGVATKFVCYCPFCGSESVARV